MRHRESWPLDRRSRARIWPLAGLCLFGMVLASLPVYAQPPPRGSHVNRSEQASEPSRGSGAGAQSSKQVENQPADTASKAASRSGRTEPLPDRAAPPPANKLAMVGPAPSSGPTPDAEANPDTGSSAGGSTAASRAGDDDRPASGRRRIRVDDDILIEGKLEKPSAFFILKRSQTDYDWARLSAKFLPLVLESVQDPLF